MNYDYRIINTDANTAFAKRMIVYLALLSATIAFALVILFLLFARYLMLLLPAGMFLFSGVSSFLVGRKPGIYLYHFSDKTLEIEGNGRKLLQANIVEIAVEKNAENSDFLSKEIKALTFRNNRIVVKNSTNENSLSVDSQVVSVGETRYILGLDEYSLSCIRSMKNEG